MLKPGVTIWCLAEVVDEMQIIKSEPGFAIISSSSILKQLLLRFMSLKTPDPPVQLSTSTPLSKHHISLISHYLSQILHIL